MDSNITVSASLLLEDPFILCGLLIMKLQIKLLPNLVDQPEKDPHQSGAVIMF